LRIRNKIQVLTDDRVSSLLSGKINIKGEEKEKKV
jgi:hypothetical protein